MSVKFTHFGGMTMLIERSDGYKILIDPYFEGNDLTDKKASDFYDVNLIVVTHAAFDHFGDAPDIFAHSTAEIMLDRSSTKKLTDTIKDCDAHRIKRTIYGDTRAFGATKIHTMIAFHSSTIIYPDGDFRYGPPHGYIIEVEPGVTYYHPGDTALYSDIKMIGQRYRPDIMICGISNIKEGACEEMGPLDAAYAVSWAGARFVFPCHYPLGSEKVEIFANHLKTTAPYCTIAREVGKTYVYTPPKFE